MQRDVLEACFRSRVTLARKGKGGGTYDVKAAQERDRATQKRTGTCSGGVWSCQRKTMRPAGRTPRKKASGRKPQGVHVADGGCWRDGTRVVGHLTHSRSDFP